MSTTAALHTKPTSVPATLNSFTKTWHPHLIATVNDQHVKVAKIEGEFIWHAHPNSDELFYILAGEVDLEIETSVKSDGGTEHEVEGGEGVKEKGYDKIRLREGDTFTVPAGVRHRPIGRNASIMMVEREGTVNTGDEVGSERRVDVVDVTR